MNSTKIGDEELESSFSLISVSRLNLERDSPIVGFYSKTDGDGQTLKKGEFTEKLDKLDANAAILLPDNLTRNIEPNQKTTTDRSMSMERSTLNYDNGY